MPTPIGTHAIDVKHRLDNPVLRPVIVNSLAARFVVVVVNDQIAAGTQLRVQMGKRVGS